MADNSARIYPRLPPLFNWATIPLDEKNPPQSLTLCTVNKKRRTFIRTRRIYQTQPEKKKEIDARISDGSSSEESMETTK